MSKKVTIEEQVAQLTKEQQDEIIKVGKIALVIQLAGGIPLLTLCLLGFWTMINPPLGFDYAMYDKLFIGFITLCVIAAVYMIGVFIFVKIKYPYYSDAKWRYINKMRKTKGE